MPCDFELELSVEGLDLDVYLGPEVVLKLRLQEGRYVPGRRVVVGEELYVGVLPKLIYALLEERLGFLGVELGLGGTHNLAEGLLAGTGYPEGHVARSGRRAVLEDLVYQGVPVVAYLDGLADVQVLEDLILLVAHHVERRRRW